MSSAPLRYRIPNPPAIFVNRKAEIDWLADAIKRAPVSVVWGPGGLGKTALVLQALHRRFKRRLDGILVVRLPPDIGDDELRQEVLRALVEADGGPAVDWGELQRHPDALVETLLERAERSGWWIVLDDLHHAPPHAMRQLLQALASYARTSRWVGAGRMNPRLGEAARVLKLSALPEPELVQLARAWGAADEVVARAVAVSGGSPWLLQQCLATGRVDQSLSRDSMLAGLPPRAVHWLDVVSLLDVALPDETILRLAPPLPPDLLETMEGRGLVERTAAGLRVHEMVRQVLKAARGVSEGPRQVATALAEEQNPLAQLEAARLAAEQAELQLLRDVLDRHGEALLASGYAPRLWRWLEPVTDARLAGWRARCAAQLGNPTAVHKVLEPAEPDPAARIAWAQTLFVQGRMAEAEDVASAVCASREAGAATRTEAALLLARSLLARGEPGAALERLHAIPDQCGALDDRRDAQVALCQLERGHGDEAMRLADGLRPRIPTLPGEAHQEVTWAVSAVYRAGGRLADAAALLAEAQTSPHGDGPALLAARRMLWLGAWVDIDRGLLDEAGQKLERLAPFTRSASVLRPPIRIAEAALRCARGELEGLPQTVSDIRREAERFGLHEPWLAAAAMEVLLATLQARPDPLDAAAGRRASGRSPGATLLHLRRCAHRLRQGGDLGSQLADRVAAVTDGEQAPLAAAVRGRLAALRGASGDAVAQLQRAVRVAAASGYAVMEAEARDGLCEVLLVLDRAEEAAAEAERLHNVAARIASPRFACTADFYQVASAEHPRCAPLERMADDGSPAPMAQRWARMLLGGSPRSDVADAALVDAVRVRCHWTTPESVVDAPSGADWSPGWGLDAVRQSVWLSDGREVDFAKRALHWRVLQVIADCGGAATKEGLVRQVWGEREYHPLRHDARLQVAVRKLRELLEDDPSAPTRIVTRDDGYGFSGPVRRIRGEPPERRRAAST